MTVPSWREREELPPPHYEARRLLSVHAAASLTPAELPLTCPSSSFRAAVLARRCSAFSAA